MSAPTDCRPDVSATRARAQTTCGDNSGQAGGCLVWTHGDSRLLVARFGPFSELQNGETGRALSDSPVFACRRPIVLDRRGRQFVTHHHRGRRGNGSCGTVRHSGSADQKRIAPFPRSAGDRACAKPTVLLRDTPPTPATAAWHARGFPRGTAGQMTVRHIRRLPA